MGILNKSTFLKLADVHAPHCVTIYMPTHRASGDEGVRQDMITLKNRLKEAGDQLKGFGLKPEEIDSYLDPVRELLEDKVFWRHQSDGIAIFKYNDSMETYQLPKTFEPYTYVSDHLYVAPLAGFLNADQRFFIMALSLGKVHFYEATTYGITEVVTEGLIPESFEEAVGTQLEEESLQFRSGMGEDGMYHSQGRGEDAEKKMEIEKYFREINEGLMEMIHDEHAPLVIACVDYLFPIYKQANTYNHLFDQYVPGNHDETGMVKLHELALGVLGNKQKEKLTQITEEFGGKLTNGTASYEENEVIKGAINGQVETLLIANNEHIYGTYDAGNYRIDRDPFHKNNNAELLNKAAIETVKHNGEVMLLDQENLPEGGSSVNAIMRYNV